MNITDLLKTGRERRLAADKTNGRTPKLREQMAARRGSKLDEGTLNAAEAILLVQSGFLAAEDVIGLDAAGARRIARFGLARLQQGDDATAEACGHLASACAPRDPLGWIVFGAACARQQKDPQAIIAYQQATTLDPKSIRAWVDLAELYIRGMELGLAAQALSKALALDPAATKPVSKRAQVLVVNTLMTLQ